MLEEKISKQRMNSKAEFLVFLISLELVPAFSMNTFCDQADTCKFQDNLSKMAYNSQGYYTSRNCYCDDECVIYNDCCEDYVKPDRDLIEELTKSKLNFTCTLERTICDSENRNNFVYSVGDCPTSYNDDQLIKFKCKKSNYLESKESNDYEYDTFLMWPHYSNRTHITYNNIYCALCNGESKQNLQPWQAGYRCNQSINQELTSITTNLDINRKFDQIKNSCTFVKWMPFYMKYRYCRYNLMSTCHSNYDNYELKFKCKNGPYRVRYDLNDEKKYYRNEYCAKCLGSNEYTCSNRYTFSSKYKCVTADITWSLLFDFNFFKGEYQVGFKKMRNQYKYVKCANDSVFDPFSHQCRRTSNQNVNFSAQFDECKIYTQEDLQFLNEFKSNFKKTNFKIEFFEYTDVNLINDTSKSLIKEDGFNNSKVVCINQIQADDDDDNNDGDDNHHKKFTIAHGILTIIGTMVSLISLCLLVFIYCINPTLKNLPGKDLICLSISFISVYVTMIISRLLTRYIKNRFYFQQMNNQSIRSIHSQVKEYESLRLISYCLALLLHYLFLCTFSWITIISFDICTTFRKQNSLKKARSDIKYSKFMFKIHLLFGYVILPFLPVMAGLLTDILKNDSIYAPHYGGYGLKDTTFWISNRIGLFLFFIVPVSLMILLNITFFFVTLCSIIRTDKLARRATRAASESRTSGYEANASRRSRILLFLKLLIVMGLSWLLGLLAGVLDEDWLFLLYTIANSFQGFFIFLCFTCNRKVFKLAKSSIQSIFCNK